MPVASGEEGQGNNKNYECCTFRGSLVALNIANGSVVWKTYTIPTEPRTLGRNAGGAVRWGPSGAGVWGAPAVDAKRHAIYAATGNMYTEPQTGSSDAVMAFDMDNGKLLWISQVTPKDVFVVGCNQPNPANCPAGDDLGPDFDFGNRADARDHTGGRDLIVIGQKSGVGWALDPDNKGAVVWQYRVGQGQRARRNGIRVGDRRRECVFPGQRRRAADRRRGACRAARYRRHRVENDAQAGAVRRTWTRLLAGH